MEKRVHRMESNGPNRITRDWIAEKAERESRKQLTKFMMENTNSVLRWEYGFTEDAISEFEQHLYNRIKQYSKGGEIE